MSEPNLQVYRVFNDKIEFRNFQQLLKLNDVAFEAEDASEVNFDVTHIKDTRYEKYIIRLRKEDFASVASLEEQLEMNAVENTDSSYYLYEFSKSELIEIFQKPYEWGRFDTLLAKKILKDKGVDWSTIKIIPKEESPEEQKSNKSKGDWILEGYLGALVFSVGGFVVALMLLTAKHSNEQGEQVYYFSPKQRIHGIMILILSGISFCVWLLIGQIYYLMT